jgi:homotetrameric cytidine deaminase
MNCLLYNDDIPDRARSSAVEQAAHNRLVLGSNPSGPTIRNILAAVPAIEAKKKNELVSAAREAAKKAHAPYSNFFVGAAVLLDDGRIFTGCNVENASYGLTICAERNAIFAAVGASGGKIKVRAVAAFNSKSEHCSPCGACRQVIAEFSSPETLIFYQGKNGVAETTMRELLPDCFSF